MRSCTSRPTGLSTRAVTTAVSSPKQRFKPRATLYSPPPSQTWKVRVVWIRPSPGSRRSITSPRLTRSKRQADFGLGSIMAAPRLAAPGSGAAAHAWAASTRAQRRRSMDTADETGRGALAPEAGSAGRQAVSEVLGDRYEILGKLGAGAFGEVYEARDTTLGRKVAIKRIRLDAFAEGPELEEVKQRFVREAQTAAKLRHPNVVTIHDIAARGSSSFMVMELVEGRTLQAILRERGRLPLAETLRILAQAADALDFAHAQGVVHRDVKPANLMVEPSGHVKVMDFGIAKASSSGDITKTGAI